MRVRMLDELEVIRTINNRTVPVRINLTTERLPAVAVFRPWEHALKTNPWVRLGGAHWVIINAEGERIYGIQQLNVLNNFSEVEKAIHAFESCDAQYPDRGPQTTTKLSGSRSSLDAGGPHSFVPFLIDRQSYTAFLMANEGNLRIARLAMCLCNPSQAGIRLVPGIREAALHSLGDFLLSDDPLPPIVEMHLRRGLDPNAENVLQIETLQQNAALLMSKMISLEWRKDDPDIIRRARDWWNRNRNNPEYAIHWNPSEVRDGYPFAIATSPAPQLCEGQDNASSMESSSK